MRFVAARRARAAILGLCLWAGGAGAKEAALEPGDVRNKSAFYSVVFYYTPKPGVPPVATLKALAAEYLPGIPVVTDPTTQAQPPMLGIEEERAPLRDYPVPDADYFKYAGRGLSPADIAAIRKTSVATRAVLVVPPSDALEKGHAFTRMAADYAGRSGAFLWDSATRECFSREAWKQKRVEAWGSPDAPPDISTQITIHLYQPDERSRYLRAITLGMEKFALPDIVFPRLISSNQRPAGNLMNLVCQRLLENPDLPAPHRTVFRLGEIRNKAVAARLDQGLFDNAGKEVTLALVAVPAESGDPENRLLALDFRHASGASDDERREAALAGLWGSADSITSVTHDDKLLAASERARKQLPALRARFAAGLKPGERLLVKAPFARDDEGNEWMWVEILEWDKSGSIAGILQNDPFYIRRLRAGARVKVRESEVFDYLLRKPDASFEGNETGKLIEASGGETRSK